MLILNKDKVLKELVEEYPKRDDSLQAIILYGSVKKGNYTPSSDVDVLLLTREKKTTKELFADFKLEILSKYFVVINALYMENSEFKNSIEPIVDTIKKEGVIIWKRRN